MMEMRSRTAWSHALAGDASGLDCQRTHREDALHAIKALGAACAFEVPAGYHLHFGQWLDWPEWLREGTSIGGSGPLPLRINLADDLIITANIMDHVDPDFLLDRIIAHSRPLVGPRITGFLSSAANLKEMLDWMQLWGNANNPHLELSSWQDGDAHIFGVRSKVALGKMEGFTGLLCLLVIYGFVRGMFLDKSAKIKLETSYDVPPSTLSQLSGVDQQWRFGAQVNQISFPSAWMTRPNPEHDPAMWLLAEETARNAKRSCSGDDFVGRIRSSVLRILAEQKQVPRLKQIAAEQGLSARTIMRSLANKGTSFHLLVEDERRKLAAQMINNPALSLAEIAGELGFTDMSSFGRSFRRWFGQTPGQFQKTSTAALRDD